MTTKILIVEDEQDIADVIEFVLQQDGFGTTVASDGDAALVLFREQRPDLVVLDLSLPGVCGIDLFHEFRREAPGMPVIIATSRSEEADRIAGLEMGADDYVTKPFSARELAARVRAVLRRVQRPANYDGNVWRAGDIMVDTEQLRVEYRGHPVALSHQEMKLLACLMRHPARIYPRDILIDLIYDGEAIVTDRTVDAQVKRIRRKFGELDAACDPIQTVYGMGYKLKADAGKAAHDA
jgi:two-component system catabolic regulation response regulator CreB